MKKFETRYLKPDIALQVFQNFRWFGYYCKVVPINERKSAVTCRRWAWSFFVLSREDYV